MMRPYGYYDTGVQHQLGLDDEANSEIANGSDMGSSAARVTSVGDLPASSVSAVQLILERACSEQHPPYIADRHTACRGFVARLSHVGGDRRPACRARGISAPRPPV